MQFSYLAPLALAAVAAADYTNSTDVTTIVTEFTTYCPEATTFAVNNKTYTVTGKTTLTITDCPCTIHPATSTPSKSTLATSSATSSEANTLSTALCCCKGWRCWFGRSCWCRCLLVVSGLNSYISA